MRVGGWIKRYWKWIIFPFGVLGILITALASAAGRRRISTVPPPDVGRAGEDALDTIVEADAARDAKLSQLHLENQERLRDLSEDQKKELEELKDKSLEEVVTWFDRI